MKHPIFDLSNFLFLHARSSKFQFTQAFALSNFLACLFGPSVEKVAIARRAFVNQIKSDVIGTLDDWCQA
jgi:hypothetical protein